jgi:pimeloyl-ACP methyl ester carboxylesterase
MWAHQLVAFGHSHTTVTYDRRGFGETSAPANLDLELEDIDVIVEQLDLGPLALVGMSQGARVALRYALTRADKVTGLVLQGAPLDDLLPPPSDSSILPLAHYASLLRQGDLASLAATIGKHPLMDTGGYYRQARDEIEAMLRSYRGEDLLALSATAAGPGTRADMETGPVSGRLAAADLTGVEAPTLVITGSREVLWLHMTSDRIARHIHGAVRRNILGGGHFVNMTHVSAYNRCVIEFLQRIPRREIGDAPDSV